MTSRLHLLPTLSSTFLMGHASALASIESVTLGILGIQIVPSCASAAFYALLAAMKRILVTGATGNLGWAVVVALKARGITVRAAARDPGKVARSAGVEAVSFDYSKPATIDSRKAAAPAGSSSAKSMGAKARLMCHST